MTREQHLKFCKKCTNRELDMKTGLLCKLTGRMADFEGECKDYTKDEAIIEKLDDNDAVEHEAVLANISEKDLQKFRLEQNYNNALIVGIVVGILGALLWGVITVITGYQIGYMAIAIGAAIGISMRYFGKGIDQIFGITGGIIAIISCFLGNFFSIIGFAADSGGFSYLDTFSQIEYSQIIPIMSSTFSVMDLFFYGIAAYEGYKFAFRTFTEKELHELEENNK